MSWERMIITLIQHILHHHSFMLYFVDQNSTFSGQFAVLHVDPCCDVVEEVAKVTSSHIKFLQPTFPPRGVMIRKMAGIPFYYDVLIYKTNKEFLALDVYVVPRDSALRQVSVLFKQSINKTIY